MRLGLLAVLFFVSLPASALVTDLSDDRIEIRFVFRGVDLILFGAIGDTVLDPDGGAPDIVVVVRGPELPMTVRRKEKVAGIWINQDSLHFPAAPGYYAVAANRPLGEIATSAVYAQSGIGFENLRLAIDGGPGREARVDAFAKALYRIRAKSGLYRQEQDKVQIIAEGLFRTNVTLPANVPVGQFYVDAFIFQDGRYITRNRIEMSVDKEGFERAVYNFANQLPFFYGLFAVLVAFVAGWLAGFIGRR